MSDIGAMVSELISAGCSPEVAAKVVAEAFLAGVMSAEVRVTSRDESVTRRRESDRLRQQKYRNKSRDVTPCHVTSADCHVTSQGASIYKKEKKEEIKKEIKEETLAVTSRVTRGQRLPDDWRPADPDWAVACALLGENQSAAEIEKFKDHWKQQPGAKGVKLDWAAAWRNWVRRAGEFRGNRNGKTADQLGGFSGLAAQLRRKIAEDEADDDAARFGPAY